MWRSHQISNLDREGQATMECGEQEIVYPWVVYTDWFISTKWSILKSFIQVILSELSRVHSFIQKKNAHIFNNLLLILKSTLKWEWWKFLQGFLCQPKVRILSICQLLGLRWDLIIKKNDLNCTNADRPERVAELQWEGSALARGGDYSSCKSRVYCRK